MELELNQTQKVSLELRNQVPNRVQLDILPAVIETVFEPDENAEVAIEENDSKKLLYVYHKTTILISAASKTSEILIL